MSIQSEITRIQNNISAALSELEARGADVPAGANSDDLATLIANEIVPVANGGTGATTAANARTNLGVTPANIGAAAASHNHSAANITSGTLPVARGGTGATAIAGSGGFLQDLFPSSKTPTFIPCFGTNWTLNGYTTPSALRGAMGLGTGTGDVAIANGGTGASTAAQARVNLGVDISDETIQMFADAGYPIE